MRKSLLLFFTFLSPLFLKAQNPEDGYYRVHNLGSERYVSITDNTGSINYQAMTADFGALQLWKNHSRTVSDPATVVYLKKKGVDSGGPYYNLQSQGTCIYEIINKNIYLYYSDGSYQLYAEGKYLCDNETTDIDRGYMGIDRKGNYRRWLADRIDIGSDEWFGITPSIECNGRFFHPFYADFGFIPVAEGMKVWYVSRVETEAAIISELDAGLIPARVPLIIECGSQSVSDNKIDLRYSYATGPAGNKLKGVYFNNPNRPKSVDSRKVFDSNTMRVLGTMSDGNLGYVLSNAPVDTKTQKQYLAANQSYLIVEPGMPDEIPVMTEREYQKFLEDRQNASVKAVAGENRYPVYMISGRKVGDLNDSQLSELPAGIYIVGNRKYVVGE